MFIIIITVSTHNTFSLTKYSLVGINSRMKSVVICKYMKCQYCQYTYLFMFDYLRPCSNKQKMKSVENKWNVYHNGVMPSVTIAMSTRRVQMSYRSFLLGGNDCWGTGKAGQRSHDEVRLGSLTNGLDLVQRNVFLLILNFWRGDNHANTTREYIYRAVLTKVVWKWRWSSWAPRP